MAGSERSHSERSNLADCPSPVKIDMADSNSSRPSESMSRCSSDPWFNGGLEVKRRPSSWDGSDDDQVTPASEKESKNNVGLNNTSGQKIEVKLEDTEKGDRRQSLARIRRRTKSSSGSSPTSEEYLQNWVGEIRQVTESAIQRKTEEFVKTILNDVENLIDKRKSDLDLTKHKKKTAKEKENIGEGVTRQVETIQSISEYDDLFSGPQKLLPIRHGIDFTARSSKSIGNEDTKRHSRVKQRGSSGKSSRSENLHRIKMSESIQDAASLVPKSSSREEDESQCPVFEETTVRNISDTSISTDHTSEGSASSSNAFPLTGGTSNSETSIQITKNKKEFTDKDQSKVKTSKSVTSVNNDCETDSQKKSDSLTSTSFGKRLDANEQGQNKKIDTRCLWEVHDLESEKKRKGSGRTSGTFLIIEDLDNLDPLESFSQSSKLPSFPRTAKSSSSESSIRTLKEIDIETVEISELEPTPKGESSNRSSKSDESAKNHSKKGSETSGSLWNTGVIENVEGSSIKSTTSSKKRSKTESDSERDCESFDANDDLADSGRSKISVIEEVSENEATKAFSSPSSLKGGDGKVDEGRLATEETNSVATGLQEAIQFRKGFDRVESTYMDYEREKSFLRRLITDCGDYHLGRTMQYCATGKPEILKIKPPQDHGDGNFAYYSRTENADMKSVWEKLISEIDEREGWKKPSKLFWDDVQSVPKDAKPDEVECQPAKNSSQPVACQGNNEQSFGPYLLENSKEDLVINSRKRKRKKIMTQYNRESTESSPVSESKEMKSYLHSRDINYDRQQRCASQIRDFDEIQIDDSSTIVSPAVQNLLSSEEKQTTDFNVFLTKKERLQVRESLWLRSYRPVTEKLCRGKMRAKSTIKASLKLWKKQKADGGDFNKAASGLLADEHCGRPRSNSGQNENVNCICFRSLCRSFLSFFSACSVPKNIDRY